jgi:hypothetical protein
MDPAGAVKDMSRTAVTPPKIFVSPHATTSVTRHQPLVLNVSS